MKKALSCMVIRVFILSCVFTVPFPSTGLDLGGIRSRREVICKDGEYWSNNICCKDCPAGTHLKSACTIPGEKGQCEQCEDETYTEHSNHLHKCIECTKCRPDQEIVQACSHTQNSLCQCKEGGFCTPEQACEMCKKCSRCDPDEKAVRNCTATSNTECKKIYLPSEWSPVAIAVSVVISVLILASGAIYIYIQKKKQAEGSEGNGLKIEEGKNEHTHRKGGISLIFSQQRVSVQSSAAKEDECQALCESLNSSASNSQHNLTTLPLAFPEPAQQAHLKASQPILRYEPFPELIPVKGEESLRSCFHYFEEISIDYYKRFFRELGLSNNVIKNNDQMQYEDRIHELLNIWYQKVGKCANLNDLLEALLVHDQRLTAESIKEKALANEHYVLKESF
ncbi:hematopoietic death receptor isoform X2 [Stigmatopora argus]